MRLHRLQIEGFGPFAGREEVDFDALAASGLFLLTGPTGAGKTSVLDAVCFALFGEVPGVRREDRLASDHRDPATTPRVTLEATVGGRRIRVGRSPQHQRPRKRGGTDGELVAELASAVLEVAGADGSWTPVAAKVQDVRHELDPLLGMTAEQFQQVVMLPQGAFATFLRADAKARQEVLERLFDAGRFSRIELLLQDRARDARAAVADARVDADRRLSAAAGSWRAPGACPLLDGDPRATVDEVRAWIADERARTASESTAAERARAEAEERRARTERALTDARSVADRQARRRDADEALRKVEAHREGRDRLAAELAAHRAAAPLIPTLSADRAARAAATDAATELAKARRYVEQLEEPALLDDPARWATASRERGERAAGLQELRRAEEALPGRERELVRLDAAAAAHARRGAEAADAVATGDADLRRAATEHEERVRRAGAADALADALRRADEALRAGVRRDEIVGRLAVAQDAVRGAVDDHQAARDAAQDLTRRRLEGFAAELATTLVPGEPCAVCGSPEHPAPAHSAAPLVTAEQQDAAAAAETRAAALRERTEAEAAELARDLAGARAAVAQAVAEERDGDGGSGTAADGDGRGSGTPDRSDTPVPVLRAARDDAAARVDAARAEARTLRTLVTRMDGLRAGVEGARRTVEEAGREQATALAEAAATRRELDATRDRIASALEGAPTIAARIYQLRDTEQRLDGAASALAKDAAAREAAERAADALRVALAASTFAQADEAIAAVLTPDRAKEVERQVRAFDDAESGARAVLALPEIATVPLDPAADVAGTEAAHAEAHAAASAAATAAATASSCSAALEAAVPELLTALDALRPLADAADRAHGLAELARGGAGNRRRIRLSSWVLAARLEQVAAAATVHLLQMSSGRYGLELHEEPASARGKGNAGLGLRVRDGWTGEARDTSTLSGGESFFASLALALGLAETVSTEAGGLDLGTLFIDEGFGTLDEQTLDEVLGVLDALRDGGRAVGIVSHVPELKQRVPVQLAVRKAREGSTLTQGTSTGEG